MPLRGAVVAQLSYRLFGKEKRNAIIRKINDFKPFIPSNDYAMSKAFYECMGFTVNWDNGDVCEVDTNFGYRLLLLPKNHNN